MLSLLLLAILLVAVSASCVALSSAAEARPGVHRHHHAHPASVTHRHHVARPKTGRKHHARSRVSATAAPAQSGVGGWWASVSRDTSRVSTARQYLGATARQLGLPRSLWCADFLNMVERRLGRSGSGSRLAMSFASYGRRLSEPVVGAIATMGRRGGGHVGVVSDFDASTVTLISGNNGNKRIGYAVRETSYQRDRIRTYTMPGS